MAERSMLKYCYCCCDEVAAAARLKARRPTKLLLPPRRRLEAAVAPPPRTPAVPRRRLMLPLPSCRAACASPPPRTPALPPGAPSTPAVTRCRRAAAWCSQPPTPAVPRCRLQACSPLVAAASYSRTAAGAPSTPAVTRLDNTGQAIMGDGDNGTSATPRAAGAGHIRPQLALDPGLVYDAVDVEQDYVDFLCTLNYTAEQIRMFLPGFVSCTRTLPGGPGDLNYPSFAVIFNHNADVRVLTRTVTKVSEEPEAYKVKVVAPNSVEVTVTPASLEFSKQKEKSNYKVVFRSKSDGGHGTALVEFGHIVWESEVHRVRSPVVFIRKN